MHSLQSLIYHNMLDDVSHYDDIHLTLYTK